MSLVDSSVLDFLRHNYERDYFLNFSSVSLFVYNTIRFVTFSLLVDPSIISRIGAKEIGQLIEYLPCMQLTRV